MTPPLPGQDILRGEVPEIQWGQGDDLCNCTFQRIGDWTNPYLARTLRVRVCCIWAKLYQQHPEFAQEIPGWFDPNTGEMKTEPMAWNGESDMPRDIFHRQAAVLMGLPLDMVRIKLEGQEPPKGVPKPPVEQNGHAPEGPLYEMIGRLTAEIAQQQAVIGGMMALIADLKSGKVKPDEVEVDARPDAD